MATINGTSGNDTLTTNTFTNDDFFGFGGNDVYEYVLDGGDDTITDSAGDDELAFGAGISRYALSIQRWGNDLLISTNESGSVTIKNFFTSSSNIVETISFNSDPSIDLSTGNLLFLDEPNVSGYYNNISGTSANETIFGSLTEAQYAAWYTATGGGSGHVHIFAGGGNDIIYASYTAAYGQDGDDIIFGNQEMHGGDGEDIFYFGTNNIYSGGGAAGEDGNDIAHGSSGIDFFSGDYGNDVFYGNDGNDNFLGGYGDDLVYGGDGDDWMETDTQYINTYSYDGAGNDTVYAGNGNDRVRTGSGDDIVYMGDGDDIIEGAYGFSYMGTGPTIIAIGTKELHGGNGDDFIEGGGGDDTITGDDGNDMITSTYGGNDYITSGNGNDTISVGTAAWEETYISGGDGNDSIDFGARYGNVTSSPYYAGWGIQHILGGNGNDAYSTTFTNGNDVGTIDIFDDSGNADSLSILSVSSTTITFNVSGTDLVLVWTGYAGSITITDMFVAAHRIESFEFSNKTGSLFETLTNFNNTYTATSTTSHLGLDHNFIEALDGNDTINAGVGNDVVWGGNGDDILNGNADNDILYGEAGNDTLRGGTGDDVLDGGADFDTASYSTATAAVTVNLGINTSSGPDGTDTFVSIEGIVGSSYADSLTGDANNNTIAGGNGNDTIYGGNGADLLYGNANNDTIYGEDGDDTLFGGAGNDTLNGGNSTDTASYTEATSAVTVSLAIATAQAVGGGQGSDTLTSIENLTGSTYNDTLTGNTGSNVLAGNNGNDTLNGGDGNDYLFGDNGNDILNGGNNDDYMVGGANDDTFDGGSGTDMARFFTSAGAVTVSLLTGTATGEGTDTLTNIENVEGSSFNDTITGSAIGNSLFGGDGTDSLHGGDGLDFLYGGNGADTFFFQGETAFNHIDRLSDYVNGSSGDFINIADVLLDYGYNALTDAITDWVSASTSGANTLLHVDRDGAGSTYSMQSIAQIDNVNLSLTDLTTNGNLIT